MSSLPNVWMMLKLWQYHKAFVAHAAETRRLTTTFGSNKVISYQSLFFPFPLDPSRRALEVAGANRQSAGVETPRGDMP